MTEIYVKNMVCRRCIAAVTQVFEAAGYHPLAVSLGQVKLMEQPTQIDLTMIGTALEKHGFSLLDSAKQKTIAHIKSIVIDSIHHSDIIDMKVNWSALIADKLHQDYASLSTLFSSIEGITLEQYIIRQKIERVKELLIYNELNINEIAFQLGYSSVQHLSTQFKKVIGETPSQFKASRKYGSGRKALDEI